MKIHTVGIVGLGLMGRNIAACLLWKGLRVVGFTRPTTGFAEARETIAAAIEDIISHGAATSELRHSWINQYGEASSMDDLVGCDFIIESVSEDAAVKRGVFEEIESSVSPKTVIGTNTSALPITLLQTGRKFPDRFVGMHWCPPCYSNRFLEIIRGEQTSDRAIEAAMQLGKQAGKEPGVVRKDIEGFIVNRLGYALYREAMHLVESGVADVATIDRVYTSVSVLGMAHFGPFRWMDLTGGAIYGRVMEQLFPTLSNSTEVPAIMRELVKTDARGTANGRGFYQYSPEQAKHWQRLVSEHQWNLYRQERQLPDDSGDERCSD